jgi:hypothetical protein
MAYNRDQNRNNHKTIAFPFVLEALQSIQTFVRPMFGCHAVYVNEKLVLMLRNRQTHPRDNGVWVATNHEYHESLKEEFPSLRTIELLGTSETAWRNLPTDDEHFEDDVLRICRLILRNDPRIGKIPKSWKKKARQ